jgi:hypothetical protein
MNMANQLQLVKKKPRSPNPSGLAQTLDELQSVNQFLEENHAEEITDAQHPRMYVLDQYIRQVLDVLARSESPGLRQLIAVSNNSPLQALALIADDKVERGDLRMTTQLMRMRLYDDLRLKTKFQANGPGRNEAAATLRGRGLMR